MSQNKPLEPRQEAFCQYYVANGFNATRAAVSAGYSENSAQEIGSQNLSKLIIQERIAELMVETVKKARKGADDVYEMASQIAFLDIGEVIEMDESGAYLKEGKKLSDIPTEIRRLIQNVKSRITKFGVVNEIIFPDKLKALEMLARFNGMNKDTLTIDSPYAGKSIDELQQIAKDKAAKLGLDAPK